mgnify:CR=1 FL=1
MSAMPDESQKTAVILRPGPTLTVGGIKTELGNRVLGHLLVRGWVVESALAPGIVIARCLLRFEAAHEP